MIRAAKFVARCRTECQLPTHVAATEEESTSFHAWAKRNEGQSTKLGPCAGEGLAYAIPTGSNSDTVMEVLAAALSQR